MVIATLDIETQGLDTKKFILACILIQNKVKPIYFTDKDCLWQYIIKLAYSYRKRKAVLSIYMHNANFDTACFLDFKDIHMRYFSTRPLIWSYVIDGKESIKFIDSMAIFNMSLKRLGELIELPKLEIPPELVDNSLSLNMDKIKTYCHRDTEIIMVALNKLKDNMHQLNLKPKRMYTISQLAISNMLRLLYNENKQIFVYKSNHLIKPKFPYEIHQSLRGARVQAFKTGTFKDCTIIDMNSSYSYAAINIDFPDIRYEQKLIQPLNNNSVKELVSKIGLSKCLVFSGNAEFSVLPIRTTFGNYYPGKNKYLLGTWTHPELKQAIELGYTIINIEYSIIYPRINNPFRNIVPLLYNKRLSPSAFDAYIFIQLLNCSYGKFAQHKLNREYIIDSVAKVEEYLNMQYKVIKGIQTSYIYYKEYNRIMQKPFYCPILTSLIYAQARVNMNTHLMKTTELLYTDTDSIISQNPDLTLYTIGERMGDFKLVESNVNMQIFGRKSYKKGDVYIVSGMSHPIETEPNVLESKQMITFKSMNDITDIGLFQIRTRNLIEQQMTYENMLIMLQSEPLYIDQDIGDITFFLNDLKRIFPDL